MYSVVTFNSSATALNREFDSLDDARRYYNYVVYNYKYIAFYLRSGVGFNKILVKHV